MIDFIIKHKKKILLAFLLVIMVGIFGISYAKTNYNMADYLPPKANSTMGIKILEEEFKSEIPNAKVMIENITLTDALVYKEKLTNIKGISSVSWLDDVVDLKDIENLQKVVDPSLLEEYYKDGCALFNITVKKGHDLSVTNDIYKIIGKSNYAAGTSINMAATQKAAENEVINSFLILVPLILIILLLTTSSWIEPILFLVTIGVAVILNMGTNFIMGDVSFVTGSIAPILQFAVSLDYAIFLLHCFHSERKTKEPAVAMKIAMQKSFKIIIASAVTTIVGFLALLFMRFEIGANLGLILVKGILLSFACVLSLLPALTLVCYKLIDKTTHKSFSLELKKMGDIILKIKTPFLIFLLLLIIPCFLGQMKINFTYGTTSIAQSSRAGKDALVIEKKFGKENPIVILVPKNKPKEEMKLSLELLKIKHITKVMSYPLIANSPLANVYPVEELNKQFYSKNYARIVVYTNVEEEGTVTFNLINKIKDITNESYKKSYFVGESMVLYDMKNIVAQDINIVNLIAILGILITLAFSFKSFLIPCILVFVIESAIWINLAITYFMGSSLSFVGYLIISTVQLGATVDYAILFTEKYLENRKELAKEKALKKTINNNLIAVLISATLLSLAGFCLSFSSSNPVVKELGILLGRGTILSFIMVICVLPALLLIFDRFIISSKNE